MVRMSRTITTVTDSKTKTSRISRLPVVSLLLSAASLHLELMLMKRTRKETRTSHLLLALVLTRPQPRPLVEPCQVTTWAMWRKLLTFSETRSAELLWESELLQVVRPVSLSELSLSLKRSAREEKISAHRCYRSRSDWPTTKVQMLVQRLERLRWMRSLSSLLLICPGFAPLASK